ncbi:hypothetical protein FDJ25_gp126 [Vibrio phage Aphrodite1]|uniref:Uncharacterized protein n=1 Tax=Vibrio phage Aphrodite1 TaxID=2070057 RepID=A0A2I7QI31_9CAUD|nr:hypothetical protein FDJ25_gp126 [Vibrio phage Aphrodite1]AUR81054.1 hypothetical protein Aphrodite1_0076 [Vibrio phage Aphrodite1]
MKYVTSFFLELQRMFYAIFYRINANHEVFHGYLSYYLGLLEFDDIHQFLHNERLQRQLEFLKYHNYKHDYTGAVFIAGCIYAEYTLKYKHHHQCLSFGQTLADAFIHRHCLETMSREALITESLERCGLTRTNQLSRDLTKTLTLILNLSYR